MPKNVVCKKCKNLVNDWCEKVIDSPDPDMKRDCHHFCEKTKADRIRSMSDFELAKEIENAQSGIEIKNPKNIDYFDCILEWLQQPAEENDYGV